jgi:hypothetical protein
VEDLSIGPRVAAGVPSGGGLRTSSGRTIRQAELSGFTSAPYLEHLFGTDDKGRIFQPGHFGTRISSRRALVAVGTRRWWEFRWGCLAATLVGTRRSSVGSSMPSSPSRPADGDRYRHHYGVGLQGDDRHRLDRHPGVCACLSLAMVAEKENDYVLAAVGRVLGAADRARQIVPNTLNRSWS